MQQLSNKNLKLGILIAFTAIYGGFYDNHITTIEGSDLSLQNLQGKTIMIVLLPVTKTQQDIFALQRIDSLSRAYSDRITFIGVPSYEYGYTDNALLNTKQYYRSIIGSQVLITGGVYTNKSSGVKQHPLFNWLTDVNQNTHFDQEVKGIGQKYFINAQGELYGVIGPEMNLSNKLMKKMLGIQ